MVFSSLPAYLDPANWQQQPNHQAGASSEAISTQLIPPPPLPPPLPPQPHGGAGTIRPGSMADRARLANIPMPEATLKCPRCESTNTKFCYFNNYSLSQPRHFCKTCRRYWTRGGALRNVPVGGGCRRNKRSKGNSSKSPVSGDRQTVSGGSSCTVSSNSGAGQDHILLASLGPHVPPLRFMPPLHHLTEFTTPSDHLGLNYGGVLSNPVGAASDHLNFQIGSGLVSTGLGTSAVVSGLSPLSVEQWRVQQGQQFPFFSGLDASNSSAGMYPFEGGVDTSAYGGGASGLMLREKISGSSGATQLASVKMEEPREVNLSRQLPGINPGNDQYWSGNAWTDLSTNFSSSSTSNPL